MEAEGGTKRIRAVGLDRLEGTGSYITVVAGLRREGGEVLYV